ncbi:Glu/Leu/Phe/Val dehydrogenase dimerization domain-containing protein [Actinoplanes friuliensis]|uniref:Leucine dehydrogenase n=1 Tax=Actinoplanes friuliensis DSM 7358 TaxID=1246995 RepID=U5W0J2_9ACTN|nr:Glu/Leu/Phe/Val dehydrogenase dimerization domain-containing protein [Actinoplanes friuliensis]AGZ41505.1 leucine dehydrogenase [Actinoplanes friuliensis DSM 7358]
MTLNSRPETVRVQRGTRTGQMIIVSVDSTVLGPALGGCRIRTYPAWRDGLDDALRLSSAMTEKAALAGLPYGGGKTVVALEGPEPRRADLLADVGDLVESFGGRYLTGPDVGTSPDDMTVLRRTTEHVLCRPESEGGSGDSSGPTAAGVLASIEAVRAHRFPGRPLESLSFAVLGLGHVGTLVASHLAAAGARLTVTDIDASRRTVARGWGATWIDPDRALGAEADVLVPSAVGGILCPDTIGTLRCGAIVGAANNQLDADTTADLLHARGICWAPDTVVSAGGIVSAIARERDLVSPDEAARRVGDIGRRLGEILAAAARDDVAPLREARRQVQDLLTPPMV